MYDDVYESLIIMSMPPGHQEPDIPAVFVSERSGFILSRLLALEPHELRVHITPVRISMHAHMTLVRISMHARMTLMRINMSARMTPMRIRRSSVQPMCRTLCTCHNN